MAALAACHGSSADLDGGGGAGTAGAGGAGGAGGYGGDPCALAALGDGHYCGAALGGTAAVDTLYVCTGGETFASESCAFGCVAKGPGAPDACAPDPSSLPPGKGVWIWRFDSSAPSATEVAARAKTLGIGFVLIKSGEDLSSYDTNFNAAIVDLFVSQGIWVFAWNYVRPGEVAAKADALAAQTNISGVKGMVLDVEIEWESTGSEADAVALCDATRAKLEPGKMLGFSSYGWLAYHPGFPWVEFDRHCGDMHLPQTYWDAWAIGPEAGYQKAVDGAALFGLTAPIWAAQDNYEGSPTSAELNQFFAVAGPYASLWRWPNPGDTALDQQLDELDWTNP